MKSRDVGVAAAETIDGVLEKLEEAKTSLKRVLGIAVNSHCDPSVTLRKIVAVLRSDLDALEEK